MTRAEAIYKWIIPAIRNTWNERKCKEILKAIEQEPILDKIRPKGEWMRMIADDDDYILPRYRCYKCGFIVAEFDRSNFCPNCGAKMESEDKGNEKIL